MVFAATTLAAAGVSGLGLEAQRAAVEGFLNGGRWKLVEEHIEIESGKDDGNRPALQRALEACKVYGATLVIAKLDRLSRDPHFLFGLQKAGVKFVAADMPEANEMMVGMLALVAKREREMTAQRTKEALAAAKARGVRLGQPKGHRIPSSRATRAKGSAVNVANAKVFAERLRPVFAELEELSANAAAAELDRRGIATARGGKWAARSVIEVRARLAD